MAATVVASASSSSSSGIRLFRRREEDCKAVFNKDVSDASSQKQFSILYGHKGGSGSLGKPGTDGNRETAVVYGQMLNLTQPPETEPKKSPFSFTIILLPI